MDTPRKTKLYNELAKDYAPKRADMQICRYIETLERRIAALESAMRGENKQQEAPEEKVSKTKK